jgi:hypothetical protein
VRSDIDMTAHWLWAEDFSGTDECWCRPREIAQSVAP